MFFPSHIVHSVADCAAWADRLVRSDLIAGFIATENDYTSNFTGAFRREINSRGISGLHATAFLLRPTVEQLVGADACIVFATPTHFKLGIFEAKWPRLTTHCDYWDSLQRSTQRSHFHEQIARQGQLHPRVALWEMFYLEHPYGAQPSYAPDYGSACIWYREVATADAHRNSSSIWTDRELDALLRVSCRPIETIVSDICSCDEGEPIPGNDFARPLADFGVPSKVLLIRYDG